MSILNRVIDRLRVRLDQVEYGKVIILLGATGTGKSETIKRLCSDIWGPKYIVHFNEDLVPQPIHDDDKRDYERISGCIFIENEDNINWQPGLFVMEDFPHLSEVASRGLYNVIRDARHTQMNFLIVAHDYEVLRHTVFRHANAILLYRRAAIASQQLAPRINGLTGGFAVQRALEELQEYHYLLVSFNDRRWCNPSINSRDVRILARIIRGLSIESEISEISYPQRVRHRETIERDTKAELIETLIESGFAIEEIASGLNTTPAYIWKVKSYMKKRYTADNGELDLPEYLKDKRRKSN